jgi:hypothetical protein
LTYTRVNLTGPFTSVPEIIHTSARTWVATGTQVTIKVGTNATFQDTGTAWITNPSAPGVCTISVGGTFGGSGNLLVSINSGQTVQARVAENLSFTVNSVATGASFPRTGILDNFNRADENPLGNGTWSCPFRSSEYSLRITGNVVLRNGASARGCYWSGATFRP